MKKSKFYPALVLGSICLVVAVLLSVINYFTAPIIDQREKDKSAGALAVVLPGGSDFKPMSTDGLPEGVLEAHSAVGGYVFKVQGTGRNGAIVVMVGVDTDGKIAGTQLISESESAGYKEPVFAQVDGADTAYKGQTLDTFETVIVSGGTLTSKGYAEAINIALRAFAAVSGGDSRTPEQKLADACNAALGVTDKTFERWFMTEVLVGVENVYVCDAGIVMVVGEKYIGINAEGNYVLTALEDGTTSEVSTEDKAIADAAYTLYANTSLTEVARPSNASKRVTKIEVTATGNYVMYMEAAGNGKNGEDYTHPSGEYITFTVSISSDGTIIDVVTTYQSESENYGDYCETYEYTSQFRGATADDIVITEEHTSSTSTDLGIISGSTVTSNGYQQALQRAFKAFELLTAEGGND